MELSTTDGVVKLSRPQTQSSPLLTDVGSETLQTRIAVPFTSRAVESWIDSLENPRQSDRDSSIECTERAFEAIQV